MRQWMKAAAARPAARASLGVVAIATAAIAVGALGSSNAVTAEKAFAAATPRPGLALNVALTGSASASTEQTSSPAGNAVDGSASTSWCSTEWTGTLTVDLGRVAAS